MPAAATPSPLTVHVPAVVSDQLEVPLVTGGRVPYANLDHAASAPCLETVQQAVAEFLPWYASVHRGAGFASQVATHVLEQARHRVRRFVDADERDAVVFTRHTTDALNLLARCLPHGTAVVCLDTEHHAALLPWHGRRVRRIAPPRDRAGAVAAVERALADCPEGPRLLVVSGASNVTGELLPVKELVGLARRHGARVALDAAQLAPHRPVSLRQLDVDYVALSGHKLYAPYGVGALVGRADWLRAAPPYLKGGGATARVTRADDGLSVTWQDGPQRHEAGSPNVIGAHALAVACDTLARRWEQVREHERVLLDRLTTGLVGVPGLRELRMFRAGTGEVGNRCATCVQRACRCARPADSAADRVGTVSFVVEGFDPGWLAAVLSAEYGVGVRDGAFCAHVATRELVGRTGSSADGALRASIGLGTATEHVDRLVDALRTLVDGHGPGWRYQRVDGRWQPVPDPRPLPPLAPPPAAAPAR